MSLLINNDLIWVSIPRNASFSIEKLIVNSGVSFKHVNRLFTNEEISNNNWQHLHFQKKQLHDSFGYKDTICIKRNWFSRWFSSLEHFWSSCEFLNIEPIIEYENIDNNFIYKTFNAEFFNAAFNRPAIATSMLVKISPQEIINTKLEFTRMSNLFLPQEQWLNGEKCTYEFDITELDKFKNFYEKRYNVKVDIPHENKSEKRPNKIILNDDLKNHLWEVFEKPITKNKKLI